MTNNATTFDRRHVFSPDILRGSTHNRRTDPPLFRGGAPESNEDALDLSLPRGLFEDSHDVRVLHVDDQAEYLDLTKELLERADESISVTGTTTVVEALNLLEEEEFDCVVSDYDMPVTNGLEFLELVRESHPDIPFILFTGKGSEDIASEAIAAGVTDYIQKKGGIDQYEILANRIQNVVDRYRTQQHFWDALSWYEQLVEQNLTGVFLVQDDQFVYLNDRFADLFGYRRQGLLEESVTRIFSEQASRSFRDPRGTPGNPVTKECEGDCADGETLSIEVLISRMSHDGEAACLGFISDYER